MRTLLRYLGGAALVGLIVVAGTWVRVGQIADRDERDPADAIVVLGAAQYDGDPSPVFRARLEGPIAAAAEIAELRWVHPREFPDLALAPLITEHMLPLLPSP